MASHASNPIIEETAPRFVPASQPSTRELLLLVVTNAVVFIITCSRLQGWHELLLHYGDNEAYLLVANTISQWNFHNVDIQHFMGYSYCIAALHLLLRVPTPAALFLVAASASILSTLLTARFFGTWVGAYFALTNLVWIQVSFLGGSETVALALSLAAFLAFRSERPVVASVLASLAVTVRPLMIAVLIGIGLTLLFRQKYLQFLKVFVTSLIIGALYAAPLAIYYGDPLFTVHTYTARHYGAGQIQGPLGQLFSWPFHGIVMGTILYPAPWTNLVLSFFWIFLVLAGVCLMFRPAFRRYAAAHPAEAIFCAVYILLIYSYDYFLWARSVFIRFAIPVLPFVFFALSPYLPKRRYILWALALASALLAALSAVGVRNVVHLP